MNLGVSSPHSPSSEAGTPWGGHLGHGSCRTGCTNTATDEAAPATHGWYCDTCHSRALRALKAAAPLVEHLLSLPALRAKSGTERTQAAQWEAPLPFNMAAFDDANHVYATLVQWAWSLSRHLGRTAPAPAARAWRATGEVLGLPANVTPAVGRYEVGIMAKWLEVLLDDILDLGLAPIDGFLSQLREVNAVAARWPLQDRPTYSKTAVCADDAGRLLIQPPRHHGDDRLIICGTCGRAYTDAEHDTLGAVLVAFTRGEKTAATIARRLTRRYVA